jgi:hypothetical protein
MLYNVYIIIVLDLNGCLDINYWLDEKVKWEVILKFSIYDNI